MKYDWENIKWIFENNGALRDIYVQEVDINDWKKIIKLLNGKYNLKIFGTNETQIDENYAIKYLTENNLEMDSKSVSINLQEIILNCHFFLQDQIEFDLQPSEIKSEKDFEKVLNFMSEISYTLNKQVTLTDENDITFPFIKVDKNKNYLKIIAKNEIEKIYRNQNKSFFNFFKILLFKFKIKYFKKSFERKIFESALKDYEATKISENKW